MPDRAGAIRRGRGVVIEGVVSQPRIECTGVGVVPQIDHRMLSFDQLAFYVSCLSHIPSTDHPGGRITPATSTCGQKWQDHVREKTETFDRRKNGPRGRSARAASPPGAGLCCFRYWPKVPYSKSRSADRSTQYTPPVPAQVPLSPKEVTPPTTHESPMRFGLPESPKQVPPVLALFEEPLHPIAGLNSHELSCTATTAAHPRCYASAICTL